MKNEELTQSNDKKETFPPVMDEETRLRYEKARRFFAKHLAPLAKEAKDAEILTKDDFAIQINAK